MINESSLLKSLGIHIDGEKIAIDTNQTKEFFSKIKSTFDGAVKNMEDSMSRETQGGGLDMDDIGVKIDNDNISIDLHKTRSFIENLSKKAEGFIGEIDGAIKDIGSKRD